MIPNEDQQKEFSDWLESISFVNDKGEVLKVELEEDDSPDPENDRASE